MKKQYNPKDVVGYDAGEFVRYIGSSDEQVAWGSCADPRPFLKEGEAYLVKQVEVHSWHTKVYLESFPERPFPSCAFEPVSYSEGCPQ